MTQEERALLNALREDADSFEGNFEADAADAPLISVKGAKAGLTPQKGNPLFIAQFDIQISVKYYNVNEDTSTVVGEIAAGSLHAGLNTYLPAFVFGNSDFNGGFAQGFKQLPIPSGWSFKEMGIFGTKIFQNLAMAGASATFAGIKGELLIIYREAAPAATTSVHYAILRVNCQQVAYGTLLAAISSDRFVLNNIRYTLSDATKLTQFDNNINLLRQTLFGKVSNDFVSPASFKKPDQFQNGIIDVPLKKGIDKETILATNFNYDTGSFLWSVYIWKLAKITA